MKTKITFAQTSCAKCRTCLSYKYRDPKQKIADATCMFCFVDRLRKRTSEIFQCFSSIRKITWDAEKEQTNVMLNIKEFEEEMLSCNKIAEDALKEVRKAVSRISTK